MRLDTFTVVIGPVVRLVVELELELGVEVVNCVFSPMGMASRMGESMRDVVEDWPAGIRMSMWVPVEGGSV